MQTKCPACNGSGLLCKGLPDPCPLCSEDDNEIPDPPVPEESQSRARLARDRENARMQLRLQLFRNCLCQTCGNAEAAAEQQRSEIAKPQSSFWRHRLRVKKPGAVWTLSGHSRALVRTGFVIEELKAFLDAGVGWKTPNPNASVICVTHTHIDHCNALPMLLRTASVPSILAPQGHIGALKELADITWSVKRTSWVPTAERIEIPTPVADDGSDSCALDASGLSTGRQRWVPACPGMNFNVNQAGGFSITVVRCFHTIEDVGYVFSEQGKKRFGCNGEAQDEYQQLQEQVQSGDRLAKSAAGRRIGAMIKEGLLLESNVRLPRLAFLCDTTIQVFGACSSCRKGEPCVFAANPYLRACATEQEQAEQLALLWQCGTIIVECSFVGAGMSDEQAETEAIARGHVAWSQLRPYVEAHPEIEFILVHFSERYTDEELIAYFDCASNNGDRPPNVTLWLDTAINTGSR